MSFPVALFAGSQFEATEMFPQRIAHQRGPIPLSSLRGLVGSL
jgi:hypothetical protein